MTKAELRQAFKALRWEDPPGFEQYWASVEAARRLGYAVDSGQYVLGATTVSVAVLDADGRPLMALSAVGFSAQLTDERIAALGADLRERAAVVGRALLGGADATARAGRRAPR